MNSVLILAAALGTLFFTACTSKTVSNTDRSVASVCSEDKAVRAAQHVAGYVTGTRNIDGFAVKRIEGVDQGLWYASVDYLPLMDEGRFNNIRMVFSLSPDCSKIISHRVLKGNEDANSNIILIEK